MSDYDDDNDDLDMAPNYEKMRGMGFICWREIPGTNDEKNDDVQVNKKKRKIDTIETEQEIETPIKKAKKKKKKNKKKNKRSNQTHATSILQLTEENNKEEVESTSNNDSIELAKKVWSDLYVSENIIRSLVEQNFLDPTPIQRLTLPAAICDRLDIIGAAETGSGKTLAFAIPILTHMNQLLEENQMSYGQFTTLILTPTRELAVQIKSHIQIACRYTKFKTAVVVGGMSTQKQERLLAQKPEIIVATPGRFWELLEEKNAHIIDMSNLRFLTIDETDRMIEKGHFEELEKILNLIKNDDNNQSRQKFVFSATLMFQSDNEKKKQTKKKKETDNQDKLATLISAVGISAKPKIIDLTKKLGTAQTLTEARVNCSLEEKDLYLYYFLTLYPGRTLIFTNSIDCIKRLQSILMILKRNPLPLHAQMEQKQRLNNLEKFSSSDNGLLIATDVAARGLDIPNIKHIIHYQVPRSTQLYIHRSGRTARAEREGLSVMFICPEELFLYRKIIKTLNRDEDLQTFPIEPTYLSNLKRRVRLASDISKLHHQVAKVTNENNWYHKAAKELDIELDENIRDIEQARSANTKDIQKKEVQLRNELDLLLKQPLKYTSALDISRSYPLLFGDPDQLASRRKNNMTALDELKHRS
jgi:ATP-dependent RNA helicase DDX24/MAK5